MMFVLAVLIELMTIVIPVGWVTGTVLTALACYRDEALREEPLASVLVSLFWPVWLVVFLGADAVRLLFGKGRC